MTLARAAWTLAVALCLGLVGASPFLGIGPGSPPRISSSPSAPDGAPNTTVRTASGPSGTVRAILLTVNNTGGTATGPFQQLVTIPTQEWADYVNANWSNVEFTYASNGTEIPAWIASGASSPAVSTQVWLSLASIPAYGSLGIDMDVLSKTDYLFSATGDIGESPDLSPVYGEYDNGAVIFPAYFDANTPLSDFTFGPGSNGSRVVDPDPVIGGQKDPIFGTGTYIDVNGSSCSCIQLLFHGTSLPNRPLSAQFDIHYPQSEGYNLYGQGYGTGIAVGGAALSDGRGRGTGGWMWLSLDLCGGGIAFYNYNIADNASSGMTYQLAPCGNGPPGGLGTGPIYSDLSYVPPNGTFVGTAESRNLDQRPPYTQKDTFTTSIPANATPLYLASMAPMGLASGYTELFDTFYDWGFARFVPAGNVNVTLTSVQPPLPPTITSVQESSPGSLTVQWTNPVGTVTGNVVSISASCPAVPGAGGTPIATATSYTFTGLSASSAYCVSIAVRNSTGNSSPALSYFANVPAPSPPTYRATEVCAQCAPPAFDSGYSLTMSAGNGAGEFLWVGVDCTDPSFCFESYDSGLVAWEYHGGAWTNLTTSSGLLSALGNLAPKTANPAGCLGWDPVSDRFLMLVNGGTIGYSLFETFALENGVWTNLSAPLPTDDNWCNLAEDPTTGHLATLYQADGNWDGFAEWSGSGWLNQTASTEAWRLGCFGSGGIADDTALGGLVEFGGYGIDPGCLGYATQSTDTYLLSQGEWVPLTGTMLSVPPGVDMAVQQGVDGGTVLYGGSGYGCWPCTANPTGLWFLGGSQWSNLTNASAGPLPPTRSNAQFGLLEPDEVVIFGGIDLNYNQLNDTWLLTVSSPSSPPPGNGTAKTTSGPTGGSGSCSSEVLAWSNPVAPPGTTLVNDTVYVYDGATNSSPLFAVISTNGAATSLQVNGLACNATYAFQVRAWFSGGLASPLSGVFPFTTAPFSLPGAVSCSTGCSSPSVPWGILLAIPLLLLLLLVVVAASSTHRGRPSGRRRGGPRG